MVAMDFTQSSLTISTQEGKFEKKHFYQVNLVENSASGSLKPCVSASLLSSLFFDTGHHLIALRSFEDS